MKATLTDGRVVTLLESDFNQAGQIYLQHLVSRGIAPDKEQMCKLLGAAPCDIHYGMVNPVVQIIEEEDQQKEEDQGVKM